MTFKVQGSSDFGVTYNDITGLTGIAITAPSQTSFSVLGASVSQGPSAITNVRINVTVYGGTTVPYVLSCASSIGYLNVTIGSVVVSSMPPPVQPSPIYTVPVSTPSSAPIPTASAGVAPPANAPYSNSISSCAVPAGATPNVTVGNVIVNQCGTNGAQNVNIVNSPAPAPTASSGQAPLQVIIGPSTAPAVVNNAYQAVIDAAGHQHMAACANNVANQCVNPTASPNAAAALNKVPVGVCANNAGTDNCVAVNASQQLAIQNAPAATASPNAGAALQLVPNAPCANNAGTTNCQAVDSNQNAATKICSAAAANCGTLVQESVNSTYTIPIARWSSGLAIPIICDSATTGSVTTALTQIIALSGSKHIYICGIVFSGIESATGGNFIVDQGTGSNCGTGTATLFESYMPTGVFTNYAYGSGLGVIFSTAGGDALCVGITAGTVTSALVSITYSQF
jgi:hypothetical protein